MIPTIFKEIKDNVEQRSQIKKMLESVIPFSNEKKPLERFKSTYNNESVRLIDEGAILYGDDMSIRAWIAKGAIQRFYDNLDDDFVGYITLGHLDLTSFPLLLGTWSKKDLTIVDLEDGRQALDCVPHLNKSLSIVNDLLSQEIPLSVSIEFNSHYNEQLSMALGADVIDEVFVQGFSIVGDPANVSSLDVFGGDNVTFKELLDKFSVNEVEEVEDTQEDTQEVEKTEETTKLEDETTEKEVEKLDDSSEVDETVEKFSALLDSMKEKIDALQAENDSLKEQLSDSKKAKKEFSDEVIEKFSNLINSQVKSVEKYDANDVFGTKNLVK